MLGECVDKTWHPFFLILKHWLVDVRSGSVVENWALSLNQCQLQAPHLMDLLSMIFRYNGFAGFIRPAGECQAVTMRGREEGGKSEGGAHMHAHALALRSIFGLTTEQIVSNCHVHSTFPYPSQSE